MIHDLLLLAGDVDGLVVAAATVVFAVSMTSAARALWRLARPGQEPPDAGQQGGR